MVSHAGSTDLGSSGCSRSPSRQAAIEAAFCTKVGRCTLPVSKPELKLVSAPGVSA